MISVGICNRRATIVSIAADGIKCASAASDSWSLASGMIVPGGGEYSAIVSSATNRVKLLSYGSL